MAGPLTTPVLEVLRATADKGQPEYEAIWDEIDRLSGHYDREGYPISMREWSILWSYFPYRQVGETIVGGCQVSTVWLGIDHNFGGGTPIIFETMVFEAEPSWKKPSKFFPDGFWYHRDYEQRRYSTELQAQEGHEQMVEEVSLLAELAPTLEEL